MVLAAPAHAARHHPKPVTQNFGRWKLFRTAAAFDWTSLVPEGQAGTFAWGSGNCAI